MKYIFKITIFIIAALTLSISAYAITPKINIKIPKIPNISSSVKITIPDNVFNDWFNQHPVNIG